MTGKIKPGIPINSGAYYLYNLRMKTIISSIMVAALLLLTAGSYAQGSREFSPGVPFDEKAAKTALEEGRSTITGQVSWRDGGKMKGSGLKVTLFPVSDYFQEYYAYRQRKTGSKSFEIYTLTSDPAYAQKLVTTADEDGNFTFYKMKPGKYYIESLFYWSDEVGKDVYAGSSSNQYGTADHYERKYTTQKYRVRLEEFVEIKADGEVKKIKLNKKRY